jgi:hypothetical protein
MVLSRPLGDANDVAAAPDRDTRSARSSRATSRIYEGVAGRTAIGVRPNWPKQTSDLFLFVRPGYKFVGEEPDLQGSLLLVVGHGIGPQTVSRRLIRQHKCLFAGTSKDGSDGTRTRDLRRDRPVRGLRRAAARPYEHPHLQGLFPVTLLRYRMAPWILQPAFGPRVGHGMLSLKPTHHREQFTVRHLRAAPTRNCRLNRAAGT